VDLADAEAGLTLSVVGYEFATGGVWDRNWLNIQGAVRSGDRTWTFASPCLLTNEARGIADWLEAVTADAVIVLDETDLTRAWDRSNLERDDEHGVLRFLEPYLAFTLRDRQSDFVVLRAHLGHAAADPALPDDDRLAEPPPWIPIRMTRDDLARAARKWRQELEAWPAR
jgi:hypothetical protein